MCGRREQIHDAVAENREVGREIMKQIWSAWRDGQKNLQLIMLWSYQSLLPRIECIKGAVVGRQIWKMSG